MVLKALSIYASVFLGFCEVTENYKDDVLHVFSSDTAQMSHETPCSILWRRESGFALLSQFYILLDSLLRGAYRN